MCKFEITIFFSVKQKCQEALKKATLYSKSRQNINKIIRKDVNLNQFQS